MTTTLTENDKNEIRKIIDEKITFSIQDLEKVGRTNYTLSEKISTLIKNGQSKLNTDSNKLIGLEPDLKKTLFFKDVLKSRIKSYQEINNYYTVVKINNKKYITLFRVSDIIDGRASSTFEEINNNAYLNENTTPVVSDFTNGFLTKLPKTIFCYYKYWLNKLTGERALDIDLNEQDNTSTSGTYPNATQYRNSILTIEDGANNNPNKRYENIINSIIFKNKLLEYDPIEIIDNNLVDSFIAEYDILNQLNVQYYSNMEQNLLNKIDDTIDLVIGVPTISTWNNSNDANNINSEFYTDNVAFYNPLLERSLNENFGYRAKGKGGGYCIKLIRRNENGDDDEINEETVLSNTIKESPFVFSSFEGFLLCYGIKNILATLNTENLDINIGNGMPPIISTCRYKGKTLEDGLITSGSNLPDANLSNLNDLFINSSENTLYRLDLSGSTKEWIRVGGSNVFNENVGINNSDPSFNLDVSGDINFSGDLYQDGEKFVASRWELSSNLLDIYRMNTKIGINTNNPIKVLDVSGDINFTGDLYQNGLKFIASNWELSGNDIFRMNTKIGINTDIPLYDLDVSGIVNVNDRIYTKNISISGEDLFSLLDRTFDLNADEFVLSYWSENNNEDIYVENKKVGINTENPLQALDVSGNINFSGELYKDGEIFVASRWELSSNLLDIYKLNTKVGINKIPSKELDISGDINFSGELYKDGEIFVASRWELSGNDIFRMNTNIGINTDNPIKALDVSGDINFRGELFQNGLKFIASNWELSGNNIFRMDTNIGINTDNPTKALDISGGMNLTGNFTLTGDITSTSDIRFKENVIQLENCLDKVINLRGVYYNFKNDNTKRIGMIAQEVEEIIPELVVDNVDRKALNYQNMVAILIEAIKELKNKNDYLEQENKNINEKLDYIYKRLEIL